MGHADLPSQLHGASEEPPEALQPKVERIAGLGLLHCLVYNANPTLVETGIGRKLLQVARGAKREGVREIAPLLLGVCSANPGTGKPALIAQVLVGVGPGIHDLCFGSRGSQHTQRPSPTMLALHPHRTENQCPCGVNRPTAADATFGNCTESVVPLCNRGNLLM